MSLLDIYILYYETDQTKGVKVITLFPGFDISPHKEHPAVKIAG